MENIEWGLTYAILISMQHYSHKLHLKLGLDSIVEVSDRAEDSAKPPSPDDAEIVLLVAIS